ncbi:AAA family ATPase [Mesorhizobium sp. 131-2-1]|uniref:AAA family ATPase n=1 Tax=Mesorhizobium sp. 131-2-1 TaxID=2744518 RepID=UPI001928A2E3|nr:AAA family ATPase [Mesorhizobium sp. 131-2-1]BCG94450.1 hypothetical protein MesoLj131a_33140 [Mesorhizobium sp. 131-2-1]
MTTVQAAATRQQDAGRPNASAKSLRPALQPGSSKASIPAPPGYVILDWDEWSTKVVPRRKKIMEPIIPEKGLVEIFSKRGVGKTFFSLGVAIAVATGTDFLRWKVPCPRRVLYVDGEMAFADLQERVNWMVAGLKVQPKPGFLRLFAADLQEQGIPDLASDDPSGREAVNKALDLGGPTQADLLILDNLSTLTRTGSENTDDAWAPVQDWLLMLRRHRVTVLFVHHAGKSGTQRGTSKREDPLDTVIKLCQPKGYKESDGSRFEIHFEKHRGFFGEDAEPFEAQFREENNVGYWDMKSLPKSVQIQQVKELAAAGNTVRQIGSLVGKSKSSVQRLLTGGRQPS